MKNNRPVKIILIGPLPPPVGGVSIHIHRLLDMMDEQATNYNVKTLDTTTCANGWGRLNGLGLLYHLLKTKGDIFHLHKPDNRVLILYYLFLFSFFGKKIIFTLHNERIVSGLPAKNLLSLKKLSLRVTLKRFSHLICVNQRIADILIGTGIKVSRVSVIPAYIPQKKMNYSSVPDTVRNFVVDHNVVLVGYVSSVYQYNGNEVYGGDMMLELIKRLHHSYSNIGFVMVIPNLQKENIEGIKNYEEFIEQHSIDDHVYICKEIVDLSALFVISDIYIRPNNTDGDPLAIRESLHLCVPTVSSDCTFKPKGTILHRDRDIDDFEMKVRHVIENICEEKNKLSELERPSYGNAVIDIYNALLN